MKYDRTFIVHPTTDKARARVDETRRKDKPDSTLTKIESQHGNSKIGLAGVYTKRYTGTHCGYQKGFGGHEDQRR
jgi:hypothetical protein